MTTSRSSATNEMLKSRPCQSAHSPLLNPSTLHTTSVPFASQAGTPAGGESTPIPLKYKCRCLTHPGFRAAAHPGHFSRVWRYSRSENPAPHTPHIATVSVPSARTSHRIAASPATSS